MAANTPSGNNRNPSGRTTEPEQKPLQDEQGRYLRNCYQRHVHTAHTHKSWYYSPQGDQAWCNGDGIPPSNTGNSYWTKPKPLKDYSEDPENYPVSDPITVHEAQRIAFHMHEKQKDKSSQPYNLHLEQVRQGTTIVGPPDAETQVAALFHDAVEDGHTSYALLRKINVTEETIKIIEAVSKRPSEEQGKYLARIIEAGPKAMRVKLSDLMHNTRADRLEGLTEATRDRLLKKYRPAMARLMLELGMIVDEDAQKKLATKPQGSSYGGWTSGTGGSKQYGKDKPGSWSASSLIGGDWPVGYPAPVLDSVKGQKVHLTLANGEMVTLTKTESVKAYPRNAWETDTSIEFPGVTEEQIADYLDILKYVKVN